MPNEQDRLSELGPARPDTRELYDLTLYVGGASPKSVDAIRNVTQICHKRLAGRCHLEIIDICQEPRRAIAEHIVAAPMLVKQAPPPRRRLVGNLSNSTRIRQALDLAM